MLVLWGLARADAEGGRCYVCSSSAGYAVYGKCGFEDVGETTVYLGGLVREGERMRMGV